MWIELLSLVLIAVGVVFFVAGTLGILRFGDALSRLHAVTKADNLGLGFVVLGLMLQADTLAMLLKLLLIWLLLALSSATVSHVIGQRAQQQGKQQAEQEPPA